LKTADIEQGENSGNSASDPPNDDNIKQLIIFISDHECNGEEDTEFIATVESAIRNISYAMRGRGGGGGIKNWFLIYWGFLSTRALWLGIHTTRLDHLVLNID